MSVCVSAVLHHVLHSHVDRMQYELYTDPHCMLFTGNVWHMADTGAGELPQ